VLFTSFMLGDKFEKYHIVWLYSHIPFETQTDRITEWLRLEGTFGSRLVQQPLLKQVHVQSVAQDHVQTAFEYL